MLTCSVEHSRKALLPSSDSSAPFDPAEAQPTGAAPVRASPTPDSIQIEHVSDHEDLVVIQVDGVAMVRLLGPQDRLLKTIERQYPRVSVLVRGNEITLTGESDDVRPAQRLVEELLQMVRNGADLDTTDVTSSATILDTRAGSPSDLLGQPILTSRGKSLRPKTLGQKEYVDAIDTHTIVFGIGPAGTGKTYLAMAKAVQALQRKEVERIILTRPAVEAGERLGFLPGTLTDKIDPYLRPLYDALNEMMDPEMVPKLLAAGTVEVAPLAYMRGRTLNNAFIVLDEAQNTSPEQMKMFLTRLGFGSKMVVTGDVTQVDLPTGASGLQLVTRVLDQIDDIHFARLTSADVVRHTLVGQIVDAYTRFDAERQVARFERQGAAGAEPLNRAERRGNNPADHQRSTRPDKRWGR
jgi:phosphate starvation-inducible PhoH-like protein